MQCSTGSVQLGVGFAADRDNVNLGLGKDTDRLAGCIKRRQQPTRALRMAAFLLFDRGDTPPRVMCVKIRQSMQNQIEFVEFCAERTSNFGKASSMELHSR